MGPEDVGGDKLHRLVRAYCLTMCRLSTEERSDPARVASSALYFIIARQRRRDALEMFALVHPEIFGAFVHEAIHPGGGV